MAKIKQFADGTRGFIWADFPEKVPCLRHPHFDAHNGYTLRCRECDLIVDPRSGRVVSENKAEALKAEVFAMSTTDRRTVIAWFTRFRKQMEQEIGEGVTWRLAKVHARKAADEAWPKFKAAEQRLKGVTA